MLMDNISHCRTILTEKVITLFKACCSISKLTQNDDPVNFLRGGHYRYKFYVDHNSQGEFCILTTYRRLINVYETNPMNEVIWKHHTGHLPLLSKQY